MSEEHLFKLKRDGKTVGYLKIVPEFGKVLLNPISRPRYWTRYDGVLTEGLFDAAHSFVTKDKHGKDVFAGDGLLSKDGLRKYKVTWDERRCRWWLCGIDKAWAVNEPIWEDYTLIEGKEDDTDKT